MAAEEPRPDGDLIEPAEDLNSSQDPPCDEGQIPCRPGRFRRWVLRPVFWGLALVATAVFLLQLWLDTPRARELARRYLVEAMSETLGCPVSLQDVRFNVLPFHVELWGLVIAGEPDPEDPAGEGPAGLLGPEAESAFLRVPYAYVEADLDALQNRRIHLQLVRVERPEIDWRVYPGGSDNMIDAAETEGRTFELWIDQVEIERADVDVDHDQARIQVDAYRVRTRLRGLGDFRLAGELSAAEVSVRLPDSKAVQVAVVARGELRRGELRVDDARIVSRHVDARVTGGCEWVRERRQHRNCTFQTRGTGRGALLRDLGYFSSLQGGVSYDGVFAWRPGAVGWRGRVTADDLLLWGRRLRRLDGALSADRFRVELDLDRAEYVGGRLSGRVVAELDQPGEPITADLELEDLELDALLADQSISIQGLSSRVDGRLLYTCELRRGLAGDGRAQVELRPDPRGEGLAVEGSFPLRVASGWVLADSATVVSENQSLLAVGAYHLEPGRGRFDYEIASADVSELVPLLPGDPPDFLPTAGSGSLSGVLQLESGFVFNTLSLDLESVETPMIPLARVRGRLDVTPWALENLHLDLRHDREAPEQLMVVRGRMPWSGAAGLTELTFDADRWPLSHVRPWVPFHLPLDGSVSGRLDLRSSAGSESGELSVAVEPAVVIGRFGSETGDGPALDGLALDGLLADLRWDDRGLEIERARAFAPAGEIEMRGRVDQPSGEMDLRLHSDGLDVGEAPLRAFLPRPDVHSTLVVDAHLAGRLDDPSLNVTLEADRLVVGEREVAGSPARLDAFWSDGRLMLGGEMVGGVQLEGGGVLDPPRVDLDFEVEAQNLGGPVRLLVAVPRLFRGSLHGRLGVEGEIGSLRTELELDAFDLRIDDRRLVAQPPLRLAFAADHWTVERLELVEPASDSRAELSGRLGYHLGAEVDLETRAELDGTWLRVALPDLDVDGRLGLEGRITGSLRRPTLVGRGSLEQGSLAIPGLEQGFEQMNGAVGFEGDVVRLDHLSGRLSGGQAALTGELRLADEGPPSYRLDLEARGVELPSVEGWLLAGDVDLALRSVAEGHLLSGEARLSRLEYREDIRFDLGQVVQDLLRGRRLEVETADDLRAGVLMRVSIRADDTVSLRNNVAELTGSADLQLRGNLAQPVLLGELTMDPGGRVIYSSNDYVLDRGRLVFADPYRLRPEVDLVATTEVRDFDVTLSLSGPVERLEARFSSEPPLPDVEVLRLLAGGETYVEQAELVPDRSSQLDEEKENSAATFLYGQAASAIGDRVNALFGFDKFRIDPLTGSGDNLSKARFTVGKRLSKDVFVTYSADPSSSDNQRIRVEWQLTDSLVLVLTQNGDNTYSADARWETTF